MPADTAAPKALASATGAEPETPPCIVDEQASGPGCLADSVAGAFVLCRRAADVCDADDFCDGVGTGDLGHPSQIDRYEPCVYDASGVRMALGVPRVPVGVPWARGPRRAVTLALPVLVQLHAGDGACREAGFEVGQTKLNDATTFSGRMQAPQACRSGVP